MNYDDDEEALVTCETSQEPEEPEKRGDLFDIQIDRLQEDPGCRLEEVGEDGTSHVWDDQLASYFAALVEALKTTSTDGAKAFMSGNGPLTIR